jgi:hypothetical protein
VLEDLLQAYAVVIIGIFVIKDVVAIKIALIQNNRFIIVSLQPTIRVNMLGHKEEFIL